ncbi:hypothetical protein BHU72_14495 [Desulfuribacillus stibiiarsenatis]|uniref:Uncharacterized protein n=2 Tax=Desulfuribacillus stibiiarsenatis TaxID=1390249 RepID=A0A1E5L7L3_9FIRM|nr:hypothetical protein BHU72_14495 [Desulfuribacillus stibiiarsenatis]
MRHSQYIKCPLEPDFFRKLGKVHSSQIRRKLISIWKLDKKHYEETIRKRIRDFGWITSTVDNTNEWRKAFQFSKARNKYDGYQKDATRMDEEIKLGNIIVEQGLITTDEPTWLSLASLAFQKDSAKESPNHFFLKELMGLFMYRKSVSIVQDYEVSDILYGQPVRYDMVFKYPVVNQYDSTSDTLNTSDTSDTSVYSKQHSLDISDSSIYDIPYIIGEVGDTELWKVMGIVYRGNQCIILPHWTWQKINPFITKHLHYPYYMFRRKGSGTI